MKIFTNGCFDILHKGHVELLKYCNSLCCPAIGGSVVVGLNSDESVKKLKGQNRPLNTELDRKCILESVKYVDEVLIFNEETPYELIKTVTPDIVVKGGDYKKEDVVGSDLCEVRIFNYIQGYSTTDLLSNF